MFTKTAPPSQGLNLTNSWICGMFPYKFTPRIHELCLTNFEAKHCTRTPNPSDWC